MKLHTFVNYGGNCDAAFHFYEKHLGGKVIARMTYDQNPDAAAAHPGLKDQILYFRMEIGGTDLMGSDTPAERFQPMRSTYLSLTMDSIEEADRIHTLLAEGGEVFMPMQETFFANRFSMLRDKFGTSWMIVHPKPMPPGA